MLVGISGKIRSGKDELGKMIMKTLAINQNPNFNPEILDKRPHMLEYWAECKVKKYVYKLKQIICILTGATMEQLEDTAFKDTNLPEEWDRWVVYNTRGQSQASGWFATRQEADEASVRLTVLNRYMVDYHVRKVPITYRQVFNEVGTDLFRDRFHPRTWVNALWADYKMVTDKSRHWGGHALSIAEPEPTEYPSWIITDVRFLDEVEAIKARGGLVFRINRPGIDRTETDKYRSETVLDNYTGFDEIITNDGTLEDLQAKTIDIVNKFNLKT